MPFPIPRSSSVASDGSRCDQAELRQCGDAIVQTTLFHDLAIDHLEYRGAGEVHFATGCGWQTTDQEVIVSRTRVGAATIPLTHYFRNWLLTESGKAQQGYR